MVGLKQFHFERVLGFKAQSACPVNQPVRIKRVPNSATTFGLEFKTRRRTAQANGVSALGLLLRGGSVFLGDVLGHVLPLWPHVRVELKRLKMNFGLNVRAQALERHI